MKNFSRLFSPKTALSIVTLTVMAVSASSMGWVDAKDAVKEIKKPATPVAATSTEVKKPVTTPIQSASEQYVEVEPLAMLREPEKYLNKKVAFEGTFNRFSDMGLDYKKAFRDSRDYVNFMILRPDAPGKTIPLSELKLFFPREKSDEVLELDSGDIISIQGSVFSTALNEPWVDVSQIKVIKKVAKSERKGEHPDL